MSLQLPTNAGQLLGLGNKMYGGLVELGQQLGITQITPAEFQAKLTAFASADNAFNAGRSARQAASDSYTAAMGALDGWLSVVKSILVGQLGSRWSTAWAQAGFINNTTQLPSKIEDRIALAGRLVAFFTANPGSEVPSMQVTAAQGSALHGAVLAAQQTLTNATRTLGTLSQSWADAFTALSDEMWSLIKILQATLNADDTRWLAFGLQMPATPSTPGKPVNVAAHLDETGAIIVQCDAVPLATRYRVRMMILGVDTDYRLVGSSPAPLVSISGVTPGQTVQLIVQAVNGSLQGVASDPIQFTVLIPSAKAHAAKPEEALVIEPVEAQPSGNGHHNGSRARTNGNGAHARA